ncbi:SRPBCC family protein [Sphingosinicella microcystinivorans]|uniref:SRPBCC family protein n=1 Tax=Sphingosinicella microcystinivorans TaxID=335406 RepID=UPI0022F37DD0|nr:SRPBCC family protein [Sphingosinicella microcystinivorans]WBX86052.1 SRPBCC family protein [Sphingosinicella microcystinivorans]
MTSPLFQFIPDPALDLVLEREIDVPVQLVWEAWTSPESIREWFCPKPWSVSSCEIDLRPGGRFNTVMRSPEGEEFPNSGCYLEIVPNERLVFTDTLLPGFRPAPKPFFTAALLLEPTATGTRYTAIAIHGNEETRRQHEEMGFHEGWNTVVDQLVAHIRASMN